MPYFFIQLLFLLTAIPVFSQRQVKAVVADSISRQVLPFATIRLDDQKNTFITGINGRFSMQAAAGIKVLYISYVSYNTKTVALSELSNNDTIFLSPLTSSLGEVVVRAQPGKIRRIVNAVIRNKSLHNPEMYERYQCNIYYKMKLDVLPPVRPVSDTGRRNTKTLNVSAAKSRSADSSKPRIIGGNNHLLFSETYSKRYYKRPQQLQDIVMASRFSGLKKTYFANLVTDILPFHVYSDHISLGGKDYINPIAKGWHQRYDFSLADEISDGNDTTFILSFYPKKNTGFNGLKGLVYINSDGYAISHFISSTTDTTSNREIRLEQVYERVGGKWFPAELNYDLIYGIKGQAITTHMNGRSIIDSVSFNRAKDFKFNRAYTARLHDSVDLRSEEDWQKLRMDSITVKELNTYRVIDSISEKRKLEKLIAGAGKLGLGKLPVGIIDIDMIRLLASNDYEGTRLGIGLYTNEKLSTHYSIGGWVGYGTRDKIMKYGLSGTFFAGGNKDNWLRFYYENDYQNAGNVRIHNDIDRAGFRNWILSRVDHKKEYGITAHGRTGYLEIELNGNRQKLDSRYENNFEFGGKNYSTLDVQEAGIGLRFAYGEKRVPAFGYYFPISTKYPVLYFRSALGNVKSGDYEAKYIRALAGLTYTRRLNRWGKDMVRMEAGIIHAFDDQPLSRSLLLAAKGFRTKGLNLYAWGGFLTMRPFDYYSDRYVSVMYRHDFEKNLWRTKFSKPYVSLAHNLVYGSIDQSNRMANAGISTPVSGYHESGILLNQLLQHNYFGSTYLYMNAGVFYHWGPGANWKNNGTFVLGLSTGF